MLGHRHMWMDALLSGNTIPASAKDLCRDYMEVTGRALADGAPGERRRGPRVGTVE